MPAVILSADIGTSSLKAAYIDLDGRLMSFCRVAYKVGSPAAAWEHAFGKALESLYAQASDCEIETVCVSGNGPTLVPVSMEGEALPPLYWYDGRIVHPREGKTLSFFLPHAAWFKDNFPAEYKKTRFFISSHEWLAYRLGAEAFTVLPPLYEPYYWDDEQCRLFGLDREKFPPFVKMGSVMGKVSAAIKGQLADTARRFGLKSGTPIIAGGPDFITALIGTGTMKNGDVCDRAGSSEGINVCAEERPKNQAAEGKGLRVLPHAKEGLWNIGAVIPSSGALFESYRTSTGREDRAYEELLAELIPPVNDVRFFAKASVDSSADHIESGRAVLCAIGFAVRNAIETLESSGFPVKLMRVSGGQGKNPLWNQLKADITGVSLMIPEISDGELAGNAVLAASALENNSALEGPSGAAEVDFVHALERTIDRMIRFREVYEPRDETKSFWEEHYRLYRTRSKEPEVAQTDVDGKG